MKVGSFSRRVRATQDQTVQIETRRPSHKAAMAAVVILLLVGAFVLFTPQGQSILNQGLHLFSQPSTSSSSSSNTSTTGTTPTSSATTSQSCVSATVSSLVSPDIHGNQAAIWYPPDYCVLAQYALTLVNQDRASNATAPVTLSYALAAQQHVDSMLYHDYFAHNDTQGYKPYIRYSVLGGRGADFENVATEFSGNFASTSDVETAIKDLENSMVNKDLACCNNLHRDNILGPLHTRVSIGIAYNSTTVYFGEEFENYYITLNFSPTSCTLSGSCQVIMTGTPLNLSVTSKTYAVYVAYDKAPSPATAAELNNGPHEYGPGLLIGGVLPSCNPLLQICGSFASGFTVYADKWTTNSKSSFDIEFSLHDFIHGQVINGQFVPGYGAGVYSIYVVLGQSTNSAITTISVFVA